MNMPTVEVVSVDGKKLDKPIDVVFAPEYLQVKKMKAVSLIYKWSGARLKDPVSAYEIRRLLQDKVLTQNVTEYRLCATVYEPAQRYRDGALISKEVIEGYYKVAPSATKVIKQGNGWLYDGITYPLYKGTLESEFLKPTTKKGLTVVQGFAFDKVEKTLPDSVWVLHNGIKCEDQLDGMIRQDLVSRYNDKTIRKSGFSGVFDLDSFQEADFSSLVFFNGHVAEMTMRTP